MASGLRWCAHTSPNTKDKGTMRIGRCILLTVLVVVSTVARAQAQWVATGYLGINVSGDVEAAKGGPGVSVTYFGGGLGFEFDFERYNHFFKDEDVAQLLPDPRADLDTDAMSLMGNVVVPFRFQGATKLRPYGAAGIGMIRAMFDSAGDQFDTEQNNFGFNVGGGVLYSLNGRVGLRSDLRYFRALVGEDDREGGFFRDYGFWRATIGVTFGFPR
jgi:opacity protein-like surface antigen